MNILIPEHGADLFADLLGKAGVPQGHVHREPRQFMRRSSAHGIQRPHFDGSPQLFDHYFHGDSAGVFLERVELFNEILQPRAA